MEGKPPSHPPSPANLPIMHVCLQFTLTMTSCIISNPYVLSAVYNAEHIVASWAFHVGGGMQLALPFVTINDAINIDITLNAQPASSMHGNRGMQQRAAAGLGPSPIPHPRRFFAIDRLIRFTSSRRTNDIIAPLRRDFPGGFRYVHFAKQNRWVVMASAVVVLRIAHLGPVRPPAKGWPDTDKTSAVHLHRRQQIQRYIAMTLESCPLFRTGHISRLDASGSPGPGDSSAEEDTPARWGMPAALGQGDYVRLPYGDTSEYLKVTSISALRTHHGVKKALALTSKAKDRANASSLQEILDGTVIASVQ